MDSTTAPNPSWLAARIVDRLLARNGSLLTGRRTLWTADAMTALTRRLDRAARSAGETFADRWRGVLRGADDPAVLLAAELLTVHLWFPDDLRHQTKLDLVTATLDRMRHPVRLPSDVQAALAQGVAGSGIAFTRRRLSQLAFLARAVAALKSRRPAQRRAALDDPWAWKALLVDVPADGGQAQREVLLHLVHPDTFEPIVSTAVKRRIVDEHCDAVPAGLSDLDAQLAAIRAARLPGDPTRPLRELSPIT
jgi:5-methylcytosine-specific restriction protein B